jgi:hypothetical protein
VTDIETRLREAMQTATSASPDPIAFDLISRRVRRRRRRTVVAACALAAVAATTPVWVTQLGSSSQHGQPTRSGPATPTPHRAPAVLDPDLVQAPWSAQRWQRLPWSTSALPRLLDPVAADPSSLVADPVGRAMAVVQPYSGRGDAPIYLLGEDGRWRVQDVVDIEPTADEDHYRGPPLGVGSLSADGTRLALPQLRGLIVIDLTTNTVRRHELPGLPQQASWLPNGSQLLVYSYPLDAWRNGHYVHNNKVVDAESGTWERVPYEERLTSYADDGTAVEAHGYFSYELRRYDSDGEIESAPVPVDLFEDSRATISAGSDAVVVMREVGGSRIPRPVGAWPGPTVLDIESGEVRAQLPIQGYHMLSGSYPIGWPDGDTALLRLGDDVVAWDYRSGELRRVTQLADGPTVTFATGLVGAG